LFLPTQLRKKKKKEIWGGQKQQKKKSNGGTDVEGCTEHESAREESKWLVKRRGWFGNGGAASRPSAGFRQSEKNRGKRGEG